MGKFMSNNVEKIKNIKCFMLRFAKYQIMAKLLIIAILFPFIKWIVSFLMKESGFGLITNNQILKFGLSFSGILSIALIVLTAIFIILIQVGGLIVISHQSYLKDEESSFIQILKFLFLKIRKLIGVGTAILIIAFLVTSPFIDFGLGIQEANLKIPGFIKDYILSNIYFNVLFKFITILGIVLAILSSFCIHIVILENSTITNAIKKSFNLVTKNFKFFIKEIFNIIFLLMFILIVSVIIYGLFASGIYFLIGTNIKEITLIILIVIFLLLIFIIDFISLPIGVMEFTKLYYKLNGQVSVINIQAHKISKLKRTITSFIATLIVLGISSNYLLNNIFNKVNNVEEKFKTKVTAHRGSSILAPENTISALKLAINNKADFSEFDVQEAKDGSIVVTHDFNFKRTAKTDINLWEMILEDVKKLDVGSFFNEKFKGEKIPTLEEYIDVAKGNIKLNIEIKKHGHEKNLVSSVVKIIEEKNFINSCVVTSLDYDVLQEVEKLNSKIETGYITFVALGDIERLNVDFYSVEETNITSTFISKAHELGREVHAWTINNEEDMVKMIDLKVDNIITDNDELAVSVMNEEEETQESISKFLDYILDKK